MRNTPVGLLVLWFAVCAPRAATQQSSESPPARAAQDSGAERTSSLVPFPFFFYTPETSTAFGVTLLYYFGGPASGDRIQPSLVQPTFIYTLKKQIIVSAKGDLFLDGGRRRLLAEASFMRFPNTFWGIGNDAPESAEEDYTPRLFNGSLQLLREVASGWYVGGTAQFVHRELVETKENGLLARDDIPGTRDGRAVSLGIWIVRDTRDNTVNPRLGSYHQMRAALYDGLLGSEYDFASYSVDLRRYVTIGPDQVLALQALWTAMTATPPFDLLPGLGGEVLLRGYFAGRYRDRNLLAFQGEYRLPLWWRFGAVGFLGVGQVARDVRDFGPGDFWTSGGVGLRFLLSPEEGLNLRADFGIGQSSTGLYLTMAEAF
ncbi:MAG: BamA/TamA family outer membrane protein [Gemmatimonadales bacterium]